MKKIWPSVYAYKGYILDGQYAYEIDWTICKDGEWIVSFPTRRDCKAWIDEQE